jgi:hypothetical protein
MTTVNGHQSRNTDDCGRTSRRTHALRRATAAAAAILAIWSSGAAATVDIQARIEGIDFSCPAHSVSVTLGQPVIVAWTCTNGGQYTCTTATGVVLGNSPPSLTVECGDPTLPPEGLLLLDSFEPWL